MKTLVCILTVGMASMGLQGCGLAMWSVAGIPATEYLAASPSEKAIVPVTTGLVAAHGGITYLLWTVGWPVGVAYLGVSGLYTALRVGLAD